MTLRLVKNLFSRAPEKTPEKKEPSELLFKNYDAIRAACFKAVGLLTGAAKNPDNHDIGKGNSAEELFNVVLDRLRSEDFRIIRDFTGRSSITTYLTAIVNNVACDRHRHEHGRDRSKERAEECGKLGELVYELVCTKGLHADAAHEWLVENKPELPATLEMVENIVAAMRGRNQVHAEEIHLNVVKQYDDDADGDSGDGAVATLVDPVPFADEQLVDYQRRQTARAVVQEFITSLDGADRLIVSLRFPLNEELESRSIRGIATELNMTEKAVDNRLRRALLLFREHLLRRGVSLSDLVV